MKANKKKQPVFELVRHYLKKHRMEILIFISAFMQLAIIYKSGFYNDDSHTLQNVIQPGVSYWGQVLKNHKEWMSFGRFFPLLWPYVHLVALLFAKKILWYKSYLLFAMLMNIGLMGYLIYRITKSYFLKFIFMLFIPLFFQIYNAHDPITSYFGQMQTLLSLLLLALVFALNWLERKRPIWLIGSLVFFEITMLAYEISFLFLPIIMCLLFAYRKSLKDFIFRSVPYTVLALANLTVVYLFRLLRGYEYAGVSTNLNLTLVIKSLFIQMVNAFPLSHFVFIRNDGIVSHSIGEIIANLQLQDIMIAAFFVYLSSLIFRKYDTAQQSVNNALLFLGLGIYIFPSVPYALSERYQKYPLGIAYLNIYIQYFGLLLLFVYLLGKILSAKPKAQKPLRILLSISACIVIVLNQYSARQYIQSQNNRFLYGHEIVEMAVKNQGLMTNLSESDTLVVYSTSVFSPYYRIPIYTGNRINMVENTKFVPDSRPFNDRIERWVIPVERTFALTSTATKDSGLLVFAAVDAVIYNNTEETAQYYLAKNICFYIPNKCDTVNVILYKEFFNDYSREMKIGLDKCEFIGEDKYGKLYSIELVEPAIMGSFSTVNAYKNVTILPSEQ